jgi:hypothetical protein
MKLMLSGKLSVGAALGLLCCSLTAPTAQAQFFGANNCNCAPVQPAMAACYQTIPVTSYVPEKQTVEVPTYETAYRSQEVTVWRPVTETKQVEIPTVTYQNVTEYQTVNRDMGRWITRYHPVAKCAPCQVDPRPGVVGWLNRTGYSMRTAFMPNYTTSREYIPNLVAFNVPVTRQVAIRGTQRVAVQETRMVAEKREEQVPYQRLVMRREERTVMRPETAWRTVPIGTATAWGPWGATQTVYALPSTESSRTAATPQPDDRFRERAARKPSAANSETDLAPVSPADTGSEPSFEPPAYERARPLPADADPVPQTRSSQPTENTRPAAVASRTNASSWKASRRPRSAALADAAVAEGLSVATADAP